MMEEAPLADPTAGLTLIAPPSANSRGSASSSGSAFTGTVAGGTNVSKLTSTAGGDRWSRLRLPSTVAVTDASGGLMSLVRAVYGDAFCSSHLVSVMRFLGSEWAVTDFTYDSHGNVREMKLPGSTEAQRMKYTYAYEDVAGMYVSRITDSRGIGKTGAA